MAENKSTSNDVLGEPTGEFVVPDSIEPIIAYKSFSLMHTAEGPLLKSPTFRDLWPGKQVFLATCVGKGEAMCDLDTCGCGVNAYNSRSRLIFSPYSFCVITAEVSMWGRIKQYSSGFRGQMAYPKSLAISRAFSEKTRRDLARAYEVPVIWRSRLRLWAGILAPALFLALATSVFMTAFAEDMPFIAALFMAVTGLAIAAIVMVHWLAFSYAQPYRRWVKLLTLLAGFTVMGLIVYLDLPS